MPLFPRRRAPIVDASTVDLPDLQILAELVRTCTRADTYDDVVDRGFGAVVRDTGWTFGLVWHIAPGEKQLTWYRSVGSVPALLRGRSADFEYRFGEGAAGRAWATKDVVFVPDASRAEGVAARAAVAAGVVCALALPLVEDDRVVGVLEFVGDSPQDPSIVPVMSIVGCTLGQTLTRLHAVERIEASRVDLKATSAVLHNVNTAEDERAAMRAALDTIRTEFGWAYGSVWRVDERGVLAFDVESGDAGAEFREVTRTSTFAKGVGLAGRTWSTGDLVFEPDMAQVTDCVRAPAAGRAGVRAGVCLPLRIDGQIVGTMDFFSTKAMTLSEDRVEALRNTAFLVSDSLGRQRSSMRIRKAGEDLLASITEVERHVAEAARVAAEAARITHEASAVVERLASSSREIGDVVKVITGIAEQTNLLALNATIEAARAGDTGKGFAVVAGEVKDLAQETAKATEEVEEKVQAIQADASSVVQALHRVSETVARINDVQRSIGGVLGEQHRTTRSVLGHG
ncbi:methyl-accepting chemotaxis protein [Austwickia chelonae]|nr:methyl-accepting chemotaxis protein [Austwickia chelonae]